MKIDARNLACPKPVILALEALPKLVGDETLEVVVNDPVAVGNLTRLASEKDCELSTQVEGEETTLIFLPRTSGVNAPSVASTEKDPVALSENEVSTSAIIAVGSSFFGRGDKELGGILMKGILYALSRQETVPKTMIFYNGGAHLTCKGSESLEDICELEARGCKILTCGTCLEFYGIRDQLAVGDVTNLYVIASIIAGSSGVTVF